jgi:argininosuccinate lyase
MKLWGGRFSSQPDRSAIKLNASIDFDKRLGPQDVRGSAAWAGALHAAGILDEGELDALLQGLTKVGQELEGGSFEFLESDEDIHTAVERRLGELTGPLAGRLHTGRSRNDQVATDLRLWLLDGIPVLENGLLQLQQALVSRAEADMDLVLPGYTHTQRAQPVLLSHWWLSHFWPLQRDFQRLRELRRRTAVLPLGKRRSGWGALPGRPAPAPRRESWASNNPRPNSIDAVSDRDFAAEFLFWAALLGVHLSRLADAVILFSSSEFGFLELSDAYATGSSLMPQKKNPDVFELARGKAGTLIGLPWQVYWRFLKGFPRLTTRTSRKTSCPYSLLMTPLSALLPVLAGALETLVCGFQEDGRRHRSVPDGNRPGGLPGGKRRALQRGTRAFRTGGEEGSRRRGFDFRAALECVPIPASRFWRRMCSRFSIPRRSVGRRRAYGGTAPEAVREQLREAVQAA